nr:KilA-N domain-containing protein [Bernardetia litoralis]
MFFTSDGWLNATQTAKNFGKDVRGYTRSEQYKGYMKILLKEQNYKRVYILKDGEYVKIGIANRPLSKVFLFSYLIFLSNG